VTGCDSHGELLGGYVLGALDPAEMEAMRAHVAECPVCGPEARELAGLPMLLDRIEPADVPPPVLSPGVEEAVLDRFARERGRRGRARSGRRAAFTVPRIAAFAAACAAAVAIAVVWSGDGEDGHAYASAKLAPLARGSDAAATAWVAEVPAGTRVRLRARGLPTVRGSMYELWCVREDGRWVSGGTFRAARDGRAEAELTAAVRPGDYHLVVVTRHARGAGEAERGPALLRGRLRY
jgi:anti-sigma-K factor RskA